MGFLDERPVAKIVSGSILIISTIAFVTGNVPAESSDAVTLLIGTAGGFLFGNSVPGVSRKA